MSNQPMKKWSAVNAKLQPLCLFVGQWKTMSTHPLRPGMTIPGFATVDWIEDGSFLRIRSDVEAEGFPSGVLILGGDDASDTGSILYFDERGVSRIFQWELSGRSLKAWRNAPKFSQRFTYALSEDGNTVAFTSELSRDDATWPKDMEQTWSRL